MSKINAYSIYSHLGMLGLLNWIPDSEYLKIQFRLKMHKKLNLDMPKTMNEKLQWLKLYDHNPKYSELVDKFLVREHIEKLLGSEYLIPLIGVWAEPKDIRFDEMPNQFVLKCNHDSGGVIICKNKDQFDTKGSVCFLQRRLKRTYSWGNREWPYTNVVPRIIAEQYIEDSDGAEGLTDYKFYCFGGKPNYVLVCADRKQGFTKFFFYDRKWDRLDYNYQTVEEKKRCVPKPDNLEEMFSIAGVIASYVNTSFVRVDLFSSNSKVYFGEITFYPHGGMDATLKPETDILFGTMINLPSKY